MSCMKRPLDGQDPDYEDTIPNEAKRLRLLEKNGNYVTLLLIFFYSILLFSVWVWSHQPEDFMWGRTKPERDWYIYQYRICNET